jgi:hypothetical protein
MTTAAPELTVRRRGDGFGRVVLLVVGIFAALIGLGLVAGGGVVVWVDQVTRGDDGYVATGPEHFQTRSYALATEELDVHLDGPDRLLAEDVLGDVRLTATSTDPDVGVFIGIARTALAERYLGSIAHDQVTSVDLDPFEPTYAAHDGGAPGAAPASERFWSASASGRGTRTVVWTPEEGDWTVVAMNADGSPGVAVDVEAGAELPVLPWVAGFLLVGGAFVLVTGGFLVYLGARRAPVERGGVAAGTPTPAA